MKTLMIYAFAFLGSSAYAGIESSGGGAAIVCREISNPRKVLSAQLYDIYEGKQKYTYANSSLSPNQILEEAMNRIPGHSFYSDLLREQTNLVIKRVEFINENVLLKASEDLGSQSAILVPIGCNLEGVGYYQADGRLLVSKDVYLALSNLEKAAFFVHEAAYKIARDTSYDRDSYATRAFVSAHFANNIDTPDPLLIGRIVYHWMFEYPGSPTMVDGAIAIPLAIPKDQSDSIILHLNPNQDLPYAVGLMCLSSQLFELDFTKRKQVVAQGPTSFKYDIADCAALDLKLPSSSTTYPSPFLTDGALQYYSPLDLVGRIDVGSNSIPFDNGSSRSGTLAKKILIVRQINSFDSLP